MLDGYRWLAVQTRSLDGHISLWGGLPPTDGDNARECAGGYLTIPQRPCKILAKTTGPGPIHVGLADFCLFIKVPFVIRSIAFYITFTSLRPEYAYLKCPQPDWIWKENFIRSVLFILQHPRVRYAACNALGQMCTDFGPLFQKKFHEKVCLLQHSLSFSLRLNFSESGFSDSPHLLILWGSHSLSNFQLVPSLLQVLDDNNNPRVQAHGAAALVNFSEECPKVILSQYLDVIILKLEEVLNSKFKEASISSSININESTRYFNIKT